MTLEKFNFLWAEKAEHTFTQEELDKELNEKPNLFKSYYLMEQLAKKYHVKSFR